MVQLRRMMVGFGVAAVVTAAVVTGAGAARGLPLPPLGSLGDPVVPKAQLDKSFAAMSKSLAKTLPGRIGLAVTPVNGDVPVSFGTLKTARAWSTLKVPVSIAAQRARGAAVAPAETRAIELSDNDAAEALWASLGGGRSSVDAVTAVLREGHDTNTRVSSEIDVPRSYPGYTPWALRDQSVFAAHLPCLPGTADVLRHMNRVAPNQQWGVAKPKAKAVTSAVKGGWGPASDATGKYVVRQLAVVTTPAGRYGVSIAALPASGSFGDGTAMVTRVGKWLLANLDKLPAGRCAPLAAPAAEAPVPASPEVPAPDTSTPTAPAPTATTPAPERR
ncbi:hypothetical protein [Gordonia sp. PP30]|uniref:hypothetical protein n=1 Tax=Gordonia sp. PP30 TaxID=2935861 RepID=UPI0032D5A1D2